MESINNGIEAVKGFHRRELVLVGDEIFGHIDERNTQLVTSASQRIVSPEITLDASRKSKLPYLSSMLV